jgi:hypothetical protein
MEVCAVRIKLFPAILILFTVIFSTPLKAQSVNVDELASSSKNDFLIVVSAGLAGAILGLSTLSFVEEPKEHTRNILVGASIGIIAGVAAVAYLQAEKSSAIFRAEESARLYDPKDFDTSKRVTWHYEELNSKSQMIQSPQKISYSFKF